MATKVELASDMELGTGCLGRSQMDEPVFVLVARDPLSGDIVREWADRLETRTKALGELTGKRQAKIAEARALAKRMDDWRAVNGGKLPD